MANPNFSSVGIVTNTASGDAFGRLRVSQPYSVWESKLLDGSGERLWSTALGGTAPGEKIDATSQYELKVSANNDFAIRQSLQKFNYQTGKSQLVLITGVLFDEPGTTSALGICDIDYSTKESPYEIYNGLYFALDNGGNRWNDGLNVVITNNGIDRAVEQEHWNIDKMDGRGPSKIVLDITKAQIFVIDYEWLGVGRVRFGLNIDGVTFYVHEFLNANNTSAVYTRSPNLPVRYELRSYGGAGQMNCICSSIMSEGGRDPSGFNHIGTTAAFSVPTNGTFTGAVNHTAISAIRHQQTKPFSFVKLINQSIITLGANAMKWSVSLIPGTTSINIGGATPTEIEDLTFTALPNTTLEFYQFNVNGSDAVLDADISNYIIEEGYIPDTGGGANPSANVLGTADNIISLGEEINGTRWHFLFTVQSYGTNTLRSSLKFTEII